MNPIQIVVGGTGTYDPAPGGTIYSNPTLAGFGFYVEKIGYGTMPYAAYAILPAGGFQLIGSTFSNAEMYVVHVTTLAYELSGSGYSNGFNYPRVMGALFGRIGWRSAPTSQGLPALTSTNAMSRSGRYFQDFHELVKLNIINAVQEDPAITDLNQFLDNLQRSAIMRLLTAVVNEREIIENVLTFDRYFKMDTPINNTGRFVGYRLIPANAFDISASLDSVSLYFDSDVTFPLYIYHESKSGYLWKLNVTAKANTSTVVQLPETILKYLSDTTMGGGFYLGYFQDDLGTAKAYREQILNYNPGLCMGWQMIEAIKTGTEQFDRVQVAFTNVTHGLNLAFSTFRDYTQNIVNKAAMFDNGIGLAMAVQVLDMIQFSVRSNKSERISKELSDKIYTDLNLAKPSDEFPYVAGLKNQLNREVSRIKSSFFPKDKLTMNTYDTENQIRNLAIPKGYPFGY